MSPRTLEAPCDPVFPQRWSPRSFAESTLTPQDIEILLEAARWAPSAMNEQPWYFLVALSEEDRRLFAACLVPENRIWADKAAGLLLVLYRRNYSQSGAVNPTAAFDTGLATMSLILQAEKLGLATHPMGGFDRSTTIEQLKVDVTKYEPVCFLAVGKRAAAEQLPEHLRAREFPKGRKKLNEIFKYGKFE